MKCKGCGADFSAGDQPVFLRGDVLGVVCRNCQGFLGVFEVEKSKEHNWEDRGYRGRSRVRICSKCGFVALPDLAGGWSYPDWPCEGKHD